MSVAAAVLVITDWCPVEFLCLHIKSKTTLYRATKGKKDSLLALVTSLLMASGPHSWQKGHILICPHNLISHHCPLLLCYIAPAMTRGNCSLSGLAINYVCDIILLKLKLNLFCGKKILTHRKVDWTVLVIFEKWNFTTSCPLLHCFIWHKNQKRQRSVQWQFVVPSAELCVVCSQAQTTSR